VRVKRPIPKAVLSAEGISRAEGGKRKVAKGYSVEIITRGRCGDILYREDGGQIVFSWEFGGGNVVAIIYGPSEKEWIAACPWAKGRREMIFRRVGQHVIFEKAHRCTPVYDFQNSWIDIVSPDGPAVRAGGCGSEEPG
jgi:hypothetical protein